MERTGRNRRALSTVHEGPPFTKTLYVIVTVPTPHPKNAPGDFYVEDGCCTACDLPQKEAPEHFEYDYSEGILGPSGQKVGHCFIRKQPSNDLEMARMVNAMHVQELGCIRYKGTDRKVISLLRRKKLDEYIDDV